MNISLSFLDSLREEIPETRIRTLVPEINIIDTNFNGKAMFLLNEYLIWTQIRSMDATNKAFYLVASFLSSELVWQKGYYNLVVAIHNWLLLHEGVDSTTVYWFLEKVRHSSSTVTDASPGISTTE